MSDALDAIPGGVISLASDLRIVSANKALSALVDRPATELVGEPFESLLSGPARILFQTHVYPALQADGRVEEVFLTVASPTGPTPVLLNANRNDTAGQRSYEVLLVRILARSRWEHDLLATTKALETERAASDRLARELATAADDLALRYADEQRTRQFRDAFIAVISHELRTPITTIYGMSQRLHERYDRLPPEIIREHLGDVALEADRLRRMTEDMLVLSRAEGGRLVIALESLAIGPVVRKAVDAEAARSPTHSFEVAASPALPLVVGEDGYVEQVVGNYLSNAVKYSPAGSLVRVSVQRDGEGVAVRVIDAGAGLGDAPPERLFELFYRAPEAAQHAPGAGIGLFVCRELINAMGGRVWAVAATSAPGAEFGFWLPAAPTED